MFNTRRRTEQVIRDLEHEIAELREDNARLRSDDQRPIDPHALAAQLDDAARAMSLGAGAVVEPSADDRQALLDLHIARQGLIEVCSRLQVLAGQLHRQLTEGTPAPEIDRRVVQTDVADDRRRPDDGGGSPADLDAATGDGPGGEALVGADEITSNGHAR